VIIVSQSPKCSKCGKKVEELPYKGIAKYSGFMNADGEMNDDLNFGPPEANGGQITFFCPNCETPLFKEQEQAEEFFGII